MRRPAKPFAVEVRKSKKSGDRDILGRSSSTGEPEPARKADHLSDIDRVFARFAPAGSVAVDAAPVPAAADLFKQPTVDIFRKPAPVAPAARILPDLTPAPAKLEEMVEEPAPRVRKSTAPRKTRVVAAEPIEIPAAPRSRKPAKVVTAKAEPIVIERPNRAAALLVKEPGKRILVRRRARLADADLRPGERWKRRLPPAAR